MYLKKKGKYPLVSERGRWEYPSVLGKGRGEYPGKGRGSKSNRET